MNNERYNQIIDEVYKSYKTKIIQMIESWDVKYQKILNSEAGGCRPYSQDKFIERIKIDLEFSEKWGLKIEERELSLEESAKWLQDVKGYDLLVGNLEHDHIREVVEEEGPTKLITLLYSNETIEVYE
jgi:hypothetical protein